MSLIWAETLLSTNYVLLGTGSLLDEKLLWERIVTSITDCQLLISSRPGKLKRSTDLAGSHAHHKRQSNGHY